MEKKPAAVAAVAIVVVFVIIFKYTQPSLYFSRVHFTTFVVSNVKFLEIEVKEVIGKPADVTMFYPQVSQVNSGRNCFQALVSM